MQSRDALNQLGRVTAAALLCLGLAGCFDFEQTFTLKNNGSGAFEVMLRMDPAFQDALEEDQILPPQENPVEVSRGVQNGQFVQEERVLFNGLGELKTRNETLSITNNGSTFFGFGPKKLSLVRLVENEGASDDGFGLMRSLFQDRYYVFTANLPGWIDQAHPVEVGSEAIEAEVKGSTVTWQIPMAKAVSAEALEFKVDFRAYLEIDAVVSAERVDGGLAQLAPGFSVP